MEREHQRKLREYAEWLRAATDQRPQRRWTPICVDFGQEEYWAIVPMGIDETMREANERANRERGL